MESHILKAVVIVTVLEVAKQKQDIFSINKEHANLETVSKAIVWLHTQHIVQVVQIYGGSALMVVIQHKHARS